MVKHIQTIRRQQPNYCFSVFDQFVGLALKGLKPKWKDLAAPSFPKNDRWIVWVCLIILWGLRF